MCDLLILIIGNPSMGLCCNYPVIAGETFDAAARTTWSHVALVWSTKGHMGTGHSTSWILYSQLSDGLALSIPCILFECCLI